MKYEFNRHEPIYDRIFFAISLDRKKQREHILIGTEYEIRKALSGYQADLLYDKKRPLGTLLTTFSLDSQRNWNVALSHLNEALHSNRWQQPELEQKATDFLKKKADTKKPENVYAAFRLWNDYLKARMPRDRNTAAENLFSRMVVFLSAFHATDANTLKYSNVKTSKELDPQLKVKDAVTMEESHLYLWYPYGKQTVECAAAYESMTPIFNYYLQRLEDWNLKFISCQRCGKKFLAESRHHTLCSEKCKKEQQTINKQEHTERTADKEYEKAYKTAYAYWQNRVRKLKNSKVSEETLSEFKDKISALRKEAVTMKAVVAKKEISEKEFTNFLYESTAKSDIWVEAILKDM